MKSVGDKTESVRLAVTYESEFDDFSEIWKKVHEKAPELKLELVPIIYDIKLNKSLWSDFAELTDIIITYMSKHGFSEFKGSQYEGISLGKAGLKCAMSSTHRLAGRKNLKFSDLIGEEVMILKHTWSSVHAAIINDIKERYPEMDLKMFTYFSADDYNDCANGNGVILTFSDLSKAHPFITTVPMKENFETSIGLTYLTPPSAQVEKLVRIIKEIVKEENTRGK